MRPFSTNSTSSASAMVEGLDATFGEDLLREMVTVFCQALMHADVDRLCGAPYGERSPERVNQRNGYRTRDWDTRVGTVELAIPKLREGSYFPGWLIEPRRRAERALVSVVAECYVRGVSTRRVKLISSGHFNSLATIR